MDATNFFDAVSGALDDAEAIATTQTDASAGTFALRIGSRDPALATDYLRSFLPASPGRESLPITVLSSRDIDLSRFIPSPRNRGHLRVYDELTLVWTAGEHSILYAFDHAARRGLVWLANGTAPDWEFSRPACAVINAAARDSSWTVAHGAAVGRAGRLLMLAGQGRAGKTTAALACVRAGWDYAGDDYIFADSSNADILPLYSSARLRDDMTGSFSELVSRTLRNVSHDCGEIKHELDLSRTVGPERIRGGRIAAILLPRRQGATQVSFTPARPTDVFQALFTTTSFSAPGPMRNYAEKLTALAARAPSYFVDTGHAPDAIPEAFERFMESL